MFPPSIEHLVERAKSTGKFHLHHPDLTEVPEELRSVVGLTELQLIRTKCEALPDWIGEFSELTYLQLADNALTSLPESVGQLTKLTRLHLPSNRLVALPDSLGQLVNLTELVLTDNWLSELPDSLERLEQLEWLMLGGNKLTGLPDCVTRLPALRQLVLANNLIDTLPDSVGELGRLVRLMLQGNRLTKLPTSFGQLTNMKFLGLAENRLKRLPESFGAMTGLLLLELQDNDLEELPESIGNLATIEKLVLTNNRLSSLPSSIGRLSQSHTIELSDNNLTALPDSIGDLDGLLWLALNGNELTSLPGAMSRMRLNRLDVEDNRLPSDLVDAVRTRPMRGLREWSGAPEPSLSFEDLVEREIRATVSPGFNVFLPYDRESFVARVGAALPADLLWAYEHVPKLIIRPRAAPLVGERDWLWDMHHGSLIPAPGESLADIWDQDFPELAPIVDWLGTLIPVIHADAHGDHHLCADFGFDPVNPPLIWMRGYECGWGPLGEAWPGKVAYLASSFAEMLTLPVMTGHGWPDRPFERMPIPQPTKRAVEWTAFAMEWIARVDCE